MLDAIWINHHRIRVSIADPQNLILDRLPEVFSMYEMRERNSIGARHSFLGVIISGAQAVESCTTY